MRRRLQRPTSTLLAGEASKGCQYLCLNIRPINGREFTFSTISMGPLSPLNIGRLFIVFMKWVIFIFMKHTTLYHALLHFSTFLHLATA